MSTGKLRERGTTVARDRWKDLDVLLLWTTGVARDLWRDLDALLLGTTGVAKEVDTLLRS